MVYWPNRITHFSHRRRVGRSNAEQVRNHQPRATPPAGKTDTPANRRVIVGGIRRGRVQHDERGGPFSGANTAGEKVTVRAADRDDCATLYRESETTVHAARLNRSRQYDSTHIEHGTHRNRKTRQQHRRSRFPAPVDTCFFISITAQS
jgi:hypothetical protein